MRPVRTGTRTATAALPAGKVGVRYEFVADRPGQAGTGGVGRLYVDGRAVGENRLLRGVPLRFSSYSGLDVGRDNGDVVSSTYRDRAPFAFTGKIGRVTFRLTEPK